MSTIVFKIPTYIYLQFLAKEQEHTDEDLDVKALEDGFVSWHDHTLFCIIHPFSFSTSLLFSESSWNRFSG